MRPVAWNNYVIVEPERPEETASHGLIIVGHVSPPTVGEVVSIGPDARVDFVVGQRVVFPPYGIALEQRLEDGVLYFFLLDHEILGVIEDAAD